MKTILKNSSGNAVSTGGKLLGKPEGANYLKQVVEGRGIDGGYYLFRLYSGDNVDFIKDIDFSENTTCYYMFQQCANIQTIPLFDTSNVTTMASMFQMCSNLTTIPQLDTSNVTNMSNMFYQCSKLTTVPQLNTSNVTNMQQMFYMCYALTTIPQLDTSQVTTMNGMFTNCSKIQKIDITTMDNLTNTSYSRNLVASCYSLTKLIIRTMTVIPPLHADAIKNNLHFTGEQHPTYNPDGLKDGRIYVPDNMVNTLKEATNWSAYADIIVPLSTLVEE